MITIHQRYTSNVTPVEVLQRQTDSQTDDIWRHYPRIMMLLLRLVKRFHICLPGYAVTALAVAVSTALVVVVVLL